MRNAKGSGKLRGKAKGLCFVMLFSLVSAAASMGMGKEEHVSSAKLLTPTQQLWVNVSTSEPNVRILLEEIPASDVRAKGLADQEFTAVANVQVFSQPLLEKTALNKLTTVEYSNVIAKMATSSAKEIVSFSPPMIILLGNPKGSDKQITRFGLLVGKEGEKSWLVWDESKEPRGSLIKKFAGFGFDVDFIKGDPGILVVSRWPSGDPGVCH